MHYILFINPERHVRCWKKSKFCRVSFQITFSSVVNASDVPSAFSNQPERLELWQHVCLEATFCHVHFSMKSDQVLSTPELFIESLSFNRSIRTFLFTSTSYILFRILPALCSVYLKSSLSITLIFSRATVWYLESCGITILIYCS